VLFRTADPDFQVEVIEMFPKQHFQFLLCARKGTVGSQPVRPVAIALPMMP